MLLCRFLALKDLKTADAPSTVAAIKFALEEDCELTDWKENLVVLSADGAAVKMGIRTGAAKRLQDVVPHLLAVHCCAHRVELVIKSANDNIPFFKSIEETLHTIYKMYSTPHFAGVGLSKLAKCFKHMCLC